MLAFSGFLTVAALLAQDQLPRPSFKTGIGLIQIDVSVLDRKRPGRGRWLPIPAVITGCAWRARR
jgi:hypothetical protein